MRVGWARLNCSPGYQIGSDENSWAFDGYNVSAKNVMNGISRCKRSKNVNFVLKEEKIYMGTAESFGRQWQIGDVVGVFLDLMDHTISFSLNGELLMDTLGGETTFSEVQGEGFVPAFTFGLGQKAKLTFGQDVNSLKFFTTCGLQEGYEPFCVYVSNKFEFYINY